MSGCPHHEDGEYEPRPSDDPAHSIGFRVAATMQEPEEKNEAQDGDRDFLSGHPDFAGFFTAFLLHLRWIDNVDGRGPEFLRRTESLKFGDAIRFITLALPDTDVASFRL